MSPSSRNLTKNEQKYFTIGSAEEIDSAIHLIFDAFENTCLHQEAVRQAKEKAAQVYSDAERERALQVIDQLGRMMDLQYWEKREYKTSYFLS
ncbi:MAG: hypothetical protein ACHP7O_14345 [Burkholderiales bacterium]